MPFRPNRTTLQAKTGCTRASLFRAMWTIWPPAKPYSLHMTNCNLYFCSENLLFTIGANAQVPRRVSGRRKAVRPAAAQSHPGSAPRIASFHLSFQHPDSVSCPRRKCDIRMVRQQKPVVLQRAALCASLCGTCISLRLSEMDDCISRESIDSIG